jgi:hypothetical protein
VLVIVIVLTRTSTSTRILSTWAVGVADAMIEPLTYIGSVEKEVYDENVVAAVGQPLGWE